MPNLPPLPGDNLSPKVTRLMGDVAQLQAWAARTSAFLDQYRPKYLDIGDQSGVWRRWAVLARPAGLAGNLDYGAPFEVKDVTEDANAPTVTVFKNSFLRKSLMADSLMEIDNLDGAGNSSRFAVGLGDLIWLHVAFKDGLPDRGEIRQGKNKGWEGFPNPVRYEVNEDGETMQESASVLIARIEDAETSTGLPISDKLVVRQCLQSNLVLLDTCYEGFQCLCPFPHAAGIPAEAESVD